MKYLDKFGQIERKYYEKELTILCNKTIKKYSPISCFEFFALAWDICTVVNYIFSLSWAEYRSKNLMFTKNGNSEVEK